MYSFRLRRGPASEWNQKNPILESGEPGFETDTGKLKIGDGVSPWQTLTYFVPGAGSPGVNEEMLLEHVSSETPHPVYDDGPSLMLLYENAKV